VRDYAEFQKQLERILNAPSEGIRTAVGHLGRGHSFEIACAKIRYAKHGKDPYVRHPRRMKDLQEIASSLISDEARILQL
jgi:hypothetical protein